MTISSCIPHLVRIAQVLFELEIGQAQYLISAESAIKSLIAAILFFGFGENSIPEVLLTLSSYIPNLVMIAQILFELEIGQAQYLISAESAMKSLIAAILFFGFS